MFIYLNGGKRLINLSLIVEIRDFEPNEIYPGGYFTLSTGGAELFVVEKEDAVALRQVLKDLQYPKATIPSSIIGR
jgi:hypothetical protein